MHSESTESRQERSAVLPIKSAALAADPTAVSESASAIIRRDEPILATTVYRSDYLAKQEAPQNRERPSERGEPLPPVPARMKVRYVALGAVSGVLLCLVIAVLTGFGLRPSRPAPSSPPARVSMTEPAPAGAVTCLRDSTQTLSSSERDQLLLDAITAFEAGRHGRSLFLLRRYTQEACDRATWEAQSILSQPPQPPAQSKELP